MTDEVHDLQRQWEWLLKHYPFPTQGCSIISATRWARILREEILAGAGRTPSTTKTGKNANG
jgi:hypothetical protein